MFTREVGWIYHLNAKIAFWLDLWLVIITSTMADAILPFLCKLAQFFKFDTKFFVKSR